MILVYGATGFTGSLIARALRDRGADIAIAGRDLARLEDLANRMGGVEVRPARAHDPRQLLDAMRGCSVVVNCAGPFSRVGEPVVRAAIDSGTHYLDTAGEQGFLRDIYERYESLARRRGVAVVNACGFENAVGDWAGELAARNVRPGSPAAGDGEDDDLDELTVGYALAGMRASRGTQLSAIDALTSGGSVWRVDRWEPAAPAAETRLIRFPDPFGEREALSFPAGDVITLPRHAPARFIQTYVSLYGDTPVMRAAHRIANLVSPVVFPFLAASPLGALARARAGAAGTTLTERERAAIQFAIVAEARFRFRTARVEVTGFDIYGVTAEIAAAIATELARRTDVRPGVLAPAEVMDAEAGLAALRAVNVEHCIISA